ncbi:hypothetical protein Bhyg_11551 [Pseudolycoriella hygida]|uniref:DUF4773 domain-containing protein n=1 Tax=Pseudolycoriella hygida TaxID=35572 RepID=A0A9Q0MVN7_9DIPT|nr:hypothetical protein Bhyg_11551 [Pseudolycoriella hygida]
MISFENGDIVLARDYRGAIEKPKQQDPQPVVEDVDDLDEENETVAADDDENDIVEEDIEDTVDEVSDVSNDIAEIATIAAVPVTNTSVNVNENDPNPINKYCTCSESTCKCCREIGLPILPVRGPGCATLQYLEDDKMLVTIQYGDFVIAQRQISAM